MIREVSPVELSHYKSLAERQFTEVAELVARAYNRAVLELLRQCAGKNPQYLRMGL